MPAADFASAAAEGAILGDYEPDRYKTDDDKKSVDRFTVIAEGAGLEDAVTRGRIVAEAQNFTRALVNEPANLLTPSKVVEAARSMAAEYQLECEVLETAQMVALGMGALLGVAQGSAEPPALIVVRYKPRNRSPRRTWAWWVRVSLSTPAASPSSRQMAWRR